MPILLARRLPASLAALLLLAAPTLAVPAGTQVVTDPSGDLNDWPLVLTSDEADITGVWSDSDGSGWTVTFQVVDLREHQPAVDYRIEFVVDTGSGSHTAYVYCQHGLSPFGYGYALATTPAGEPDRRCTAATYVAVDPLEGTVLEGFSGAHDDLVETHVEHEVDAVAETVTVDVPYAAIGASSGDGLEDFYAYTFDYGMAPSVTTMDEAWGTAAYTLA